MRNIIAISLLIFFVLSCSNKKQYDKAIKIINLSVNNTDFDYIYSHPFKDTSITGSIDFNNQKDSIKLRVRGSSSREYDKKSLKITLKSSKLLSAKKINLNSEFTDKSYIRQLLATKMFKKSGQECYNAEHVIVNLNNSFFGIYLMVENMDDKFLKRNHLDIKGNLYKATHDGACMSIYDNIHEKWEKKTHKKESWKDLEDLIKEVNTIPSKSFDKWVKHTFEYEHLINYVAINMLLANGSTYYHNYYLYHDLKTNKWRLLPWDMDKSISYYSWMPYQHNRTSSNWESDNPLIEKLLINDVTYQDIIARVKVLENDVFSSTFTHPLIDSLKTVLSPYIDLDTTDKISNKDEWEKQLEREKEFLDNHPKQILEQLKNYPRGFELNKTPELVFPEYVLSWNKSRSEIKKDIAYRVKISHDFDFKDSLTLIFEVADTSFKLPNNLDLNNKYFWQVIATDGDHETEGFNTKNFFTIKKATELTNSNSSLSKEQSPYIIRNYLIVKENETFELKPGTVVYMLDDAELIVKGNLIANGTEIISIKQGGNFNSIEFFNPSISILKNTIVQDINLPIHSAKVTFDGCTFISKHRVLFDNNQRISLIWSKNGEVTIRNCTMVGNGTGEGINLNYSKCSVQNNFICSIPDAIELIGVSEGDITNNYVFASQDDAIDLNGCSNVVITNNRLFYNNDKGISIGAEEYGKSTNITIKNNLIGFNSIGISIKDSSDAVVKNCTITNNKLGLEAYKKQSQYMVGGNLNVSSCIIKNNNEKKKSDKWSIIKEN